MNQESITAVEKIIGNCGIRFTEVPLLEKSDFNLEQKTILVTTSKTGQIRKATIRPSDIDFFACWFKTISERLFPCTQRTLHHNLQKIGVKPFDLRTQLKDQMKALDASDGVIATKLGHYVNPEDMDKKTEHFKKLQQFEQEHFGVIL